MRINFIQLFLIFALLPTSLLWAKIPPDKEATTWAINELSKLSFEEQLAQLIWFNESEHTLKKASIVTDLPFKIDEANKLAISYSILNIFDGIESTDKSPVPFPSKSIRKTISNQEISFALEVYSADIIIDINPTPNTLFYGVSLNNSETSLTPHFRSDSLLIALNQYDQVWWLSQPENALIALTKGKKVSKKLKKNIYILAEKALAKKYEVHSIKNNRIAPENFDNYTRWAWKQYSSAITLLNNPGKLPLKTLDSHYFCTTTIGDDDFYGFRRHLDFYTTHSYYANALDFKTEYNLKRLSSYDYLIVPAKTLTNVEINNLNSLSNQMNVILAWFSTSPPPKELSDNITQIQTFQLNGVTEALVPQLIFGALGFVANKSNISYAPPSVATLPVGRLQFGPPALVYLDSKTLGKIDTLVENGIRQQATPGSQILVAKNGIVVYYQNFGHKTYQNQDAIKDQYLYDLASLTKVMATTQAIMFLTERGMLNLDRPIAHYLPEMWGTDKEFIPVREILAHQAGLYPYIPFWKQVLPKRDLEAALTHKKSKDAYQIGKNTYIAPYLQDSLLSWSIHSKRLRKSDSEQPYGYRYSDIGFIILKTLVERIVNQPLNQFLDQNLYAPLGMNHTTFTPLCKFSEEEIVPTEGNGKFRIGELTGFVNDQNAALLGGVSGHAGLFGNALDLAKLMQLQLQLGTYGGTTFLYPETILNFTKRQYVGNRRGLGWDKPSRGSYGPTTDLASQKTFGHTGFTGTAAWADPEHQLIFIFLSNRVYPDAGNFKLNELNIRTRIQGLLYEAIDFNN